MMISVSLPASDTLHTLVVGLELDPSTVDRQLLHRELQRRVNEVLDDHDRAGDTATWERVLLYTANRYRIAPDAIVGRAQTPDLTRARKVAYLAGWRCGLSYAEIGRQAGRDHTTVMSGVRSALKSSDAVTAATEIVDHIAGRYPLGETA